MFETLIYIIIVFVLSAFALIASVVATIRMFLFGHRRTWYRWTGLALGMINSLLWFYYGYSYELGFATFLSLYHIGMTGLAAAWFYFRKKPAAE